MDGRGGRFDLVLPPPEAVLGSTVLGEYVLMRRTARARDLPEAARRLLAASATKQP